MHKMRSCREKFSHSTSFMFWKRCLLPSPWWRRGKSREETGENLARMRKPPPFSLAAPLIVQSFYEEKMSKQIIIRQLVSRHNVISNWILPTKEESQALIDANTNSKVRTVSAHSQSSDTTSIKPWSLPHRQMNSIYVFVGRFSTL